MENIQELGPWKLKRLLNDQPCVGFNKDTGEIVSINKSTFFNNKEIPKSEFLLDYIQVIKSEDIWILISEFMENRSLSRLIQDFGKLNENLTSRYTRNILKGLEILHAQDIFHGNLKSENILTRKDASACISELGIHKSQDHYSKDIWDLGIIVLEMVTGVQTKNDQKISNVFRSSQPLIPLDISSLLSDFLSKCFIKNPSERWSASLLLMHPWITCYNVNTC